MSAFPDDYTPTAAYEAPIVTLYESDFDVFVSYAHADRAVIASRPRTRTRGDYGTDLVTAAAVRES